MIENLTSFDKDLLLRWFLYYMPQGQEGPEVTKATRSAFMQEYPGVYNRLYGETVQVIHNSTGTPA